MNCSQARILLSAYRELKTKQVDTSALEEHLEHCAVCRDVLAQNTFVGERLQMLSIEPQAQAYHRLMLALAEEHTRFLQQATAKAAYIPPTPDFLKPFLQKHAAATRETDVLTAFSTAETGPLPIIQARHKRRPFAMNQFAVMGLAAAILLVIMTGGLVSLLMLTRSGSAPIAHTTVSGIVAPSQVALATYTTHTPYTYVVSAVGNRQFIYYTAYNENTNAWMLEQLEIKSKVSTPLLATESNSDLVLLGSSQQWLLWLQLDPAQTITPQHIHTVSSQIRTWRLQALSLAAPATPQVQQTMSMLPQPITLLSGTFDEGNVPAWVHSPIQGIWFMQNTFLLATLDQNGTAHLLRSTITAKHTVSTTEITSAHDGHILTSPTANSTGTALFWADEWTTSDGNLHSTIWTQQVTQATPTHGLWSKHTIITTSLLRSDGTSFQPQIVDNTLFFLNTNQNVASNSTTSQASSIATATATPASSTNTSALNVISRADATIYQPQIDVSIQGILLSLPLASDATTTPTALNTGLASVLQGGTDFLLWQNDKGYEMYDVAANSPVTIGNITNGAAFLNVNSTTAVWFIRPTSATPSNTTAITFNAFNWPRSTQALP